MADQPTVSVEFTRTRARSAPNHYVELAESIRTAGLLRRRYGYYWTMLAAVPIVYAACFVAFILIGDSWWQMFTAVVFAVVFTQTAFLGHDAAHRQIFKSGKWNDWVSVVVGDLFIGMSYGWWQNKHTRRHASPNQVGADPDIDLPVIAFTPEQAATHRNALSRWLMAHQGWFFFPILLLEGLSLHFSGFKRVLSREKVDRRWAELALLVIRFALYLSVVFIVLSPDKAVVFLAIQLGLFGFYMGMSFAPNHKGMPLLPAGEKNGLPEAPGDDEPQHPRQQDHRCRHGRPQLPDRTPPVPVDGEAALEKGGENHFGILPSARCALHRDRALALLRDSAAVHQSGRARCERPVRVPSACPASYDRLTVSA